MFPTWTVEGPLPVSAPSTGLWLASGICASILLQLILLPQVSQ